MLEHISRAINRLTKVLKLRKPGRVFLVIRKDEEMLRFVLVLPEVMVHDVVERRLTLQIGENEPLETTVESTVRESAEYSGEDGDVITGSLIDVDDAGNESEPRDFEFVLSDTLPPPQPGEFGIRVTGEDPPAPPVE